MSHFMSVDYIMRETSDYIYSKGRYYKVPNNHMLAYQFSPNQEHLKMATMFTGTLGMKQKIQNRSEQEKHWHGHWAEKLNQNWRYSLVNTRNLVEEDICNTQPVSLILKWYVAI